MGEEPIATLIKRRSCAKRNKCKALITKALITIEMHDHNQIKPIERNPFERSPVFVLYFPRVTT